MGGGTGEPGPTDAWITLAGLARETSRIRLGTLVTSATFRLPGAAGDRGGAGGPDVAAGGSSSASAPAGSRPSTPRTASRSRRCGSASTGWRSSWRSSPGCGRTPPGERTRSPARTTGCVDSPGAAQAGAVAASAGDRRRGRAQAAPRRWPPGSRPSSTSPFRPLGAGGRSFERVRRRPARRPAATRAELMLSVAQTVCVRPGRRRGAAAGRGDRPGRRRTCGRTGSPGRWPRSSTGSGRARAHRGHPDVPADCSTWTTSTTSS